MTLSYRFIAVSVCESFVEIKVLESDQELECGTPTMTKKVMGLRSIRGSILTFGSARSILMKEDLRV
jgi:hypothetical protein